jgi:predicted MFS family arabinose efflux permease
MRTFYAVIVVVNLTQSAAQAVLVILVVDELGLPGPAYGVLLTLSGVGAFLGGLLSSRVGDALGVHRVLLPAVALSVPILATVGLASGLVVLATALALNSFAGVLANIQMISMRQRIVPASLLGRVSSVSQFLSFGVAIPLGALIGGAVADAFGVRWVFAGGAVVTAVPVGFAGRRLYPPRLREGVEELAIRREES